MNFLQLMVLKFLTDFTSDDDVGGCADHEFVKLDQWTDGSADNTYFTIQIEANDYFKSQNNCNEYDWYVTEEEDVMHKLIITAYVNDISEQMYIAGSHYSNHPDLPTNVISAYYKLERDQDGNDNGGSVGIFPSLFNLLIKGSTTFMKFSNNSSALKL